MNMKEMKKCGKKENKNLSYVKGNIVVNKCINNGTSQMEYSIFNVNNFMCMKWIFFGRK